MSDIARYLTMASIAFGFLSAGSWLRASFAKVSHEVAMEQRRKDALKRGQEPNYASVSLDGWDMSATFAAQAKWNGLGAFFAAFSILFQAVAPLL
ncbi:hypothetical protein [Herbaspirillum frisingense]|uniref:hypothetical protein n=1 Tax=Herbaspirillum frisingense TaxID=92645 RepID=UPI001F18C7FC|nr:hypothetical protein [Herbaspirillum frisingense]UIN23505.1 hypothetical protein LAZ82_10585 [Herbaspirillum frisingense]